MYSGMGLHELLGPILFLQDWLAVKPYNDPVVAHGLCLY
jgi:hypothetical protein